MPIEVLMPALSPTMEKGNLAKWLKKEGDSVKSGDIIAEIETDKATMEVEAVDEGVVEQILVPEGTEEVKVNTPIARLAGEGAVDAPAPPAELAPQSAPTKEAPDATAAGDPSRAGAVFYLGLADLKLNRMDEAQANLQRAIALAPTTPNYHFALGMVLKVKGNGRGAIAEFTRELELNPGHQAAAQQAAEIQKQIAGK